MLRIVHGNRAESLLSALLEALPRPLDPFVAQTIVVGSHLVARWLQREIAIARGIAAGLELPTFDRFIERTWTEDAAARAAGITGLDRGQLGAMIASVLADEDVIARVPIVRAYLDAAPAPGDRAGPRRVQLADRLADLTWQYATTRPDWMPALLNGRAPTELDDHPGAAWQAAVIGAAFERLHRIAPTKRYSPTPLLPLARRRAELAPPILGTPVSVFGLSFLQRSQLEALSDLAQTSQVTVYLLDPCRELWDDVRGRSAAPAGDGAESPAGDDPLPLVLWGRPVRDTLAALVERSGGNVDDAFVEAAGESARERMLFDMLDRRPADRAQHGASQRRLGSEVVREAGVTVFACPNPRRELEVVADEARRSLDEDPTLRAHEIAVWIAGGDRERYLAQAPSAFEAVGVPYHLVDAPINDRGRIGEAVLALLELPTSAMRRRDLLRVMTHPAVLAGFPHVDAEDWVGWTERLGIVHGSDGDAHTGTYLEDHHGHFHWDQGVRRLALGAFMVGDRGPVVVNDPKYGRLEVAPEEIRPELQASAATYALMIRSLCADAAWLATCEYSLARWAEIFVGIVDSYLAARSDDAARDLERVKSTLAGLARLDLDGRALGFREAREYAARLIESARSNRGEPLASGVMVAPVGAMRAVPFRVTFVVGLDQGGFPATDQPNPLDLRTTPRPGDVTPRDRDRHAFLELLLSARDALYLSYVASEEKSGSALGPSSVVLELADALAPYLGETALVPRSSREALAAMTVRHPLHRFTEYKRDGVDQRSVVPAVERERWAKGVRDAIRTHLRLSGQPVPDEDGMLELIADPSQAALRDALALVEAPSAAPRPPIARALSVANLRTFLEYPIQAWAQAVLGLYELDDDTVTDHSDEPFQVDRMQRALLLREVLAAWLRDPGAGVGVHYDRAVAGMQLRGQYPVGVFADAERNRDLHTLEQWRAHLGPIAVGGVTRIGFGRAHSPGAELRAALEISLSGGRTVRLMGQTEILLGTGKRTSVVPTLRDWKPSTPYHLRGALDHLVLAAAGLAPTGHTHVVLDPNGKAAWVDHAPWAQDEAQKFLASLCTELLDESHGYLLPFDALVKALGGDMPKLTRHGDLTGGLGYGPIDRRDGLALPRNPLAIAQRRLRPLVVRMTGEHGFEVDA
ncbi:MAG: Exodeoxyribonuclease [Myxococcales bacterium]|nr:Exodeoxyribonuclease [Myxococcales bacterium]